MNVGSNKGHRLQVARSRFAAMLIQEARDVTGFNFKQLDQALGLEEGYSRRYSLYPKKCRAPQAARLQDMENRIAKLLKRSAHVVVLEDLTKVVGKPHSGLNARDTDKYSLWLTYADNWPTYDCLKNYREPGMSENGCDRQSEQEPLIHELVGAGAAYEAWPHMLRLYAWQWGVLWDKGLPWLSREALGVAADTPVEVFLPIEVEKAKPALAHGRKGEMSSSFYCDQDGPIELDNEPPDVYFDALETTIDAQPKTRTLPEICRNGVVIYCDFGRSRVTKSLVKSGDGW
jgi:hypothetical protein